MKTEANIKHAKRAVMIKYLLQKVGSILQITEIGIMPIVHVVGFREILVGFVNQK